MTPGPKKKGHSQKNAEEKPFNRKNDNCQRQQTSQRQSNQLANKSNVLEKTDQRESQDDMEANIGSNWSRYEEPTVDPYADISRGDDFEVLLSYSCGAGSQLQLQEEREWNEFKLETKNLVFDMNRLNSMLKCIPFHKRLDIPSFVFSTEQIQNFEKCSENNFRSLGDTLSITEDFEEKEVSVESQVQEKLLESKGEYILEEDLSEPADNSEGPTPPILGKTENLIESLSSCLFSKATITDTVGGTTEVNAESPAADADDLSYLLSLTAPSRVVEEEEPKHDTTKKLTKSNVDEWLSSILDD